MMYNNNFVVVIKHNGKVLRESDNGTVRLPFGSDYTILLKNKDSRKAVADVEIDGENVASSIIVPGNDSVELKGALHGLKVSNHFRFIKKTREISNYRGDRPDDGLVRVEYRFEQYEPVITIKSHNKSLDRSWFYYNSDNTMRYFGDTVSTYSCNNSISDAGITVPGAETSQNFVYGSTKPLETQSYVIILQLRGLTKGRKKIRKPVTVKTVLRCSTCGRRSKSSVKFCGNCGTYIG